MADEPPEEGRHYDPLGYEDLKRKDAMRTAFGVGQIVAWIWIVVAGIKGNLSALGFGIVLFFATIIAASIFDVVYRRELKIHQYGIARAKGREQDTLRRKLEHSENKLEETTMALSKHEEMLKTIQDAQNTGDIIITGDQSPVFIDSEVKNSFNTIRGSDPELAAALKTLGGYIENSGNREAAEQFSELHAEVASDDRSPARIRAFWNEIVRLLPDIERMTDVARKITGLFS